MLRAALDDAVSTPAPSPSRKRPRLYNDRFIPNREGLDLQAGYSLLHAEGSPASGAKPKKRTPNGELHFQRNEEANQTYHTLLRSELFANEIPQNVPQHLATRGSMNYQKSEPRATTPPPTAPAGGNMTPRTPSKNLFTYMSPKTRTPQNRNALRTDARAEIYSLSPIRFDSQRMLLSPRKQTRDVAKQPYKVLDAPELKDDFYLNLVDWGSSGVLGVGLGSCVYMWNATSGKVDQLCSLENDTVTSVNWIQRGSQIAIGTHKGYVQIWDANKERMLRTMDGHTQRVGALAWNSHVLTSGSRDRTIYHRDVRISASFTHTLKGHKQEVCGLKWNSEDNQLASGGNDNKLIVWDGMNEQPLYKFTDHKAAVKAIAWSPHQHGLLASGGGTQDRSIKFWNTLTGSLISEVDTGSQVCNLAWSKNSNEIVSTHGYSENQIVVWKYPSMQQVASLTGHTYRVLYLAMSPDGQVIVTGAGDETLRFWNCFQKNKNDGLGSIALDAFAQIR
ncbi:WD40 repeat-like protein [Ascobolus immersus RN42]|uniref:WD40 repeat-like protein n=1 Tax=Ascobolus immersus RN42 TaxID=1160509 RepID=A0A3N4IMH9_ASCIM|nr:WD40 repeat-like protein [Ascobolus immersus RN42]